PGAFAAFGLAKHRSGKDEYFSNANFEDPKGAKSSTTVFAGVPVGRASLLTSGIYIPEVALANFGNKPARVTVTLAATINDQPKSSTVSKCVIPAGETKLLKLEHLTGSDQLLNSFIVKSDADPGQVQVKLAAIGDGPLHELELQAKGDQDG